MTLSVSHHIANSGVLVLPTRIAPAFFNRFTTVASQDGKKSPKRFDPLGVDGTTRIQKAQKSAEISDQLADLSYKELRDLQVNIEQGKTDGVPRELLG